MTSKSSEKPQSTKPPLPWKTRLLIAVLSAVTDASSRSDGTVNRRLLSFLDSKTSPNPKPHHGVKTTDVTVDPSRNLWIRLFIPTVATSDGGESHRLPVIVFFHGGGFAYLSPASMAYDAVCRRIARKIPAVIASVNYRLAPENRFPAPYDDGFDVLRFLDEDEEISKIADLSSCFLAGDSAGGNIAHHVAHRWTTASAAGGWRRVRIAGMVVIQPYFGGEERTESEIRLEGAPLVSTGRTDWLWKAFLPVGSDRDHEACNVFGPGSRAVDLGEEFPPTMVIVGGYDPLKDWQKKYYEGLRERGKEAKLVEYPSAIHAFYVFPELKESGELIEEMRGFIETYRSKDKELK